MPPIPRRRVPQKQPPNLDGSPPKRPTQRGLLPISRKKHHRARSLTWNLLLFVVVVAHALWFSALLLYSLASLSIAHDSKVTGLEENISPRLNAKNNENVHVAQKQNGEEKPREVSSQRERKNGFEHSPQCSGCVYTEDKYFACGLRIKSLLDRNPQLTLEEALIEASQTFEHCKICHPDACKGGTKYWRYDAASPTALHAVTHFLPSIPSSWRLPPSTPNVKEYMDKIWKEKQSAQVLFEYNPTLIALDPAMIAKLSLGFGIDSTPAYLASYRVASNVGCYERDLFGQINDTQALLMRQRQNYLGLALLQADLTMIPGSDIVVDLEKELGLEYPTEPRRLLESHGPLLMDFRLFSFNGKIYLNINGPPALIVPIEISIPKKPYSPVPVTKQMIELADKNGIKIPNLFGEGIEVTLARDLRSLYGLATLPILGKNYALFQTSNETGDILAELQPPGPHIVQKIAIDDVEIIDEETIHRRKYPDNVVLPKTIRRVKNIWLETRVLRKGIPELGNATISEEIPPASFSTVEEIWFRDMNPFLDVPHGGACCVQLDRHPRGSGKLLVGIGHTKVPWRKWRKKATPEQLLDLPHHQYVSSFYAFEPTPPYRTVARSGLFCLPFSEHDEGNPYFILTEKRKFSLKRKDFECPQISFVSGITEKAGDDTKVIVSYGINDCTPRMVEFDKSEIARLLFNGPDWAPGDEEEA